TAPAHELPPGTGVVDFDALHERFARVEQSGDVSIRRVEDYCEIYRLPRAGSYSSPCLSANGQFLAITDRRDAHMELWRLTARDQALMGRYAQALCVFSPDSTLAAVARLNGTLTIHDLVHGRQIAEFETSTRPICVGIEPGNRSLAVGTGTMVQIL